MSNDELFKNNLIYQIITQNTKDPFDWKET